VLDGASVPGVRAGAKLSPMPVVDLNADVGEGAASSSEEARLIGLVTSASVGCGAHAGTPSDMEAAVRAALSAGVVLGAHPSFPDRTGFGRRPIDMSTEELTASISEQIATLDSVVRAAGGTLRYVKPHGALYHLACGDEYIARLLGEEAGCFGIAHLLLAAGSPTVRAARETGMTVVGEGFVDRRYRADGSLVPRDLPGALVEDEERAVAQALALVEQHRAPVLGGGWVDVEASSLCLHGDTPRAARLAWAVRRELGEAGVRLASFVA